MQHPAPLPGVRAQMAQPGEPVDQHGEVDRGGGPEARGAGTAAGHQVGQDRPDAPRPHGQRDQEPVELYQCAPTPRRHPAPKPALAPFPGGSVPFPGDQRLFPGISSWAYPADPSRLILAKRQAGQHSPPRTQRVRRLQTDAPCCRGPRRLPSHPRRHSPSL